MMWRSNRCLKGLQKLVGTFDLLRHQKRRTAALLVLLVLSLGAPKGLEATATAPTPGDNVLLIFNSGDAYAMTLKDNIKAALLSVTGPWGGTPTITELAVPATSNNGIADDIPQPDKIGYLLGFCQVWDLRFLAGHNSASYSGTIQGDSITSGCPTCDQELFLEFLRQGGHLYLQGDHAEYYARNETLVSFIQSATGSPLSYPGITTATVYWTTHDNTAPDNFNTNYDGAAIGQLGTYYPGYIPSGGWAGGKALTKDGSNNALALLWDSAQLSAGNGKLIAMFDSNPFSGDTTNISGTNNWQAYVRHLYTALSTCYNFSATKTVTDAGPLCIGQTTAFVLCTHNTGTRALPAQSIWDSIPTCFSYASSNPAPSGNTGRFYTWAVPSLNGGENFCVTVNVTVANGGPCP